MRCGCGELSGLHRGLLQLYSSRAVAARGVTPADHSAFELRDRHRRLWRWVGVDGLAVWPGRLHGCGWLWVSSDADGQEGEAHDTRAGEAGGRKG